jgi:hypothetical protein
MVTLCWDGTILAEPLASPQDASGEGGASLPVTHSGGAPHRILGIGHRQLGRGLLVTMHHRLLVGDAACVWAYRHNPLNLL